jgi:pyruvate kinase
MLSGETAKGAYPIETVDMMSKICTDAESAINYDVLFNTVKDSSPDCGPDESVACAAVKCATEQNAKAIITMTTSGRTARLLAKYRPACPIIPVSKDVRAARQLHLSRGCYPLYYPGIGDSEQSATIVERVNYGPDHPSLLRPTHERAPAPHTRMHTRTAALPRSAILIAHSLGVIPPSCSY